MAITDPLVLPVDVAITAVGELPRAARRRIQVDNDAFALSRARGRTPIKIISAESARLLEAFRQPQPVSVAIRNHARKAGRDASQVLVEAFPLIRDCYNAHFLVPAGSPESAAILPTRARGDRIGPYIVLRCLHLLEDTELYHARDQAHREVAVKLVRPGATRDTGPRLRREARILSHLAGRGAPRLLGVGRHRGRTWIAMSWCRGVPPDLVFGELRAQGDRPRMLRLAARIARAYARLHRRGILHGDIHPNNILVGRSDTVTLVDFGLARALPPLRIPGDPGTGGVGHFFTAETASALRAGAAMPAPSEPMEQYAVGAVLYYLVTGRHYADLGLERDEVLARIADAPPRPFTQVGAPPWPDLESVLRRALEKDPAARFPDLAAMTRALERVDARPVPATREARPTPPPPLVDQFLAAVDYDAPAFLTPGPPPTGSIMLGRGGIAYALYRLACLRDDAALLALADAWLCRIEADLDAPDTFSANDHDLSVEALSPVSPFHAASGIHLLRALLSIVIGDDEALAAAVAHYCETAGRPWTNPDFTLGLGSVVVGAAALLEALPAADPDLLDPLLALGARVLGQLWEHADRAGPIGPNLTMGGLGMAHGWAGLLYATLRWSTATGARPRAACLERLRQLARCAESVGRGVHWWQPEDDIRPDVLASRQVAGWCNGPAGFIPLWTLAHHCYRHQEFLRLAEGAAWSTWDSVSPLPDLCCGLTGRAYGLLTLYRHTGEPAWLARATGLAERAVMSFDRTRNTLERPLGLYKGMAGLVLLLADLERPERTAFPFFEPEGWPRQGGSS